MKTSYRQVGSAHAVIAVLIVVAILVALGVVFFNNYNSNKNTSTSKTTKTEQSQTDNTITEVSGTDMMRFSNRSIGFQFDFPKQINGAVGCEVDETANAPTPVYKAKDGTADMTVLSSSNKFTITQKKAPAFTVSAYEGGGERYNSACEVVDVSQAMIDDSVNNSENYDLATEMRSWQVYKLASESEIAEKAKDLTGYDKENVTKTEYSLDAVNDGKQTVKYTFAYKAGAESGADSAVGGVWYYPAEKLLVQFPLQNVPSFMKPGSTDSYYTEQIVNSFKPVN